MNVGLKAWRSGSSAAAFSCGWWPRRTRPRIVATSTMRPKTCASGRNSSVDASSPRLEWNTDSQRPTTLSASNMKLACESTQPLGRPVVPDV